MRVRVWINGSAGPSYDFELVEAPRVGEQVQVTVAGEALEGTVMSVAWHLQAIERSEGEILLEGEPVGSVSIVHVVCESYSEAFRRASAAAEVDTSEAMH